MYYGARKYSCWLIRPRKILCQQNKARAQQWNHRYYPTDGRHQKYISARQNECYSALGLKPNASKHEIKAAYILKCKELHPDLHPESRNEEMHLKFIEIQKAYDALMRVKDGKVPLKNAHQDNSYYEDQDIPRPPPGLPNYRIFGVYFQALTFVTFFGYVLVQNIRHGLSSATPPHKNVPNSKK